MSPGFVSSPNLTKLSILTGPTITTVRAGSANLGVPQALNWLGPRHTLVMFIATNSKFLQKTQVP